MNGVSLDDVYEYEARNAKLPVLVADKVKIRWLHECSQKTEWENRFLWDIEDKEELTLKQLMKLDEIYKKMRRLGGVLFMGEFYDLMDKPLYC